MSILKQACVSNPSETDPLLQAILQDGRDYKLLALKRTLSQGDIGDKAGQTQYKDGCLIGTVQGGNIHDVIQISVMTEEKDGSYVPLADDKKMLFQYKMDGKNLILKDKEQQLKEKMVVRALLLIGN